jgi:hypothetical protein
MSKIVRKTQQVFGGNLVASNNIAQFGSLKAGSIAYSLDPAVIQSLAAWGNGWSAAVTNNNAPALQDLNAFCYLSSLQLAYLMQAGVAEWDSGTTYYTGSLVQDGSGNIFYSLVDSNLNNALTDITKWVRRDYIYAYVGTNPEVGGSSPFQMVSTNKRISVINPAGAITQKLPTTNILVGDIWTVINRSTNVVTFQSSGGEQICASKQGRQCFLALQNTPTDAAHWLLLSGSTPTSQVFCDTGNGHGSTNTKIRKYTNSSVIGSDITYTSSATNGDSFTINRAGIYTISSVDGKGSGSSFSGVSLNSAQLTTDIDSINIANRLYTFSASTGVWASSSITIRLASGDVVRVHDRGDCDYTSIATVTICQVDLM